MQEIQVTVTRYLSVDGVEYETAEKAILADLEFFLGPHMFRNMDPSEIAEVIWNNRDLIVKTLTQLQEQFENVDG